MTTQLLVMAGLNLALPFLLQSIVIRQQGPGAITDAFFASLVLPQFVYAVVAPAVPRVLVPLLTAAPESERRRFVWTLVYGTTAACIGVGAILQVTSRWWLQPLLPGFDHAAMALIARLVGIQLIALPAMLVAAVVISLAYTWRRFLLVEIASLAGAGVALLSVMLWLSQGGIEVAAWATVARWVLFVCILLPLVGAPTPPAWRHPLIGTGLRRIRPLLGGTVYYKAGVLVDRALTSTTGVGDLTLYAFGQQFYAAANQAVAKAFANPLLQRLSHHASLGDWVAYRREGRQATRVLLLATAAAGGGLLAFGTPVLTWLGLVGSEQAARRLSEILASLLGLLVFGSVGALLAARFYAVGRTRAVTWIGAAGFTAGLLFKILSYHRLGIVGVGLGTSLNHFLNAWLLAARGGSPALVRADPGAQSNIVVSVVPDE